VTVLLALPDFAPTPSRLEVAKTHFNKGALKRSDNAFASERKPYDFRGDNTIRATGGTELSRGGPDPRSDHASVSRGVIRGV
jgi:hypothetical protein